MNNMLMAGLMMLTIASIPCIAQNTNVVVKGKLTNVPDSLYLYIVEFDNQRGTTTARGIMINGELSFEFNTRINKPHLATIRNHEIGLKPLHLIWIEPGANIRITGDGLDYSTWKIESNVKTQQNENRFREATQAEESKMYQLNTEICRLNTLYSKGQKPKEIKEQLVELSKLEEDLYNTTKERVLPLLEELPVDEAWILQLFKNSQTRNMDVHRRKKLIELSQLMSEEQKKSYFGKEIMQNLNPPKTVNLGDTIPDVILQDTLGKSHRLTELKGKFLLLDFWSSACAPCIKSLPELKEIAEIFKEKLNVVSICNDPKDIWKSSSQEHHLTWYNWNDFQGTTGIFADYGIESFPTYIIVSPDGKIIGKEVGYSKGSLFKFVKEHTSSVEKM